MPYQNVTMAVMESATFDRRALPKNAEIDFWHAQDGWLLRRFRMGAGDRGAMLFLNGRADMIEKYLEPMAHWAARGWAVTSFDWRGQGGSGRFVPESDVGHCSDFRLWIDDLVAFFLEWRAANPGPHVAVAHSMGGHLLSWALAERRMSLDAVALAAPMFGIKAGGLPGWAGAVISRFMCRTGDPARAAWPSDDEDAAHDRGRRERLTHCAERYADEQWWRRTCPDIALGPPSWGWIAEAYRSTRGFERSPVAEGVAAPMLILAAENDKLVDMAAIRRIARRLPDARLHVYGAEAAHEILREADGVRIDALSRIDAFLDERTPRPR